MHFETLVEGGTYGIELDDQVLGLVARERVKANMQHGGPSSDDDNGADDWLRYIARQIVRGREEVTKIHLQCVDDHTFNHLVGQEIEDRLIKIAGLALAALESRRRRQAAANARVSE